MKLFKILLFSCLALGIVCDVKGQTITNVPITLQQPIFQNTNIYPTANGTNYWWDMGITNNRGYFVYQSVNGTNHVYFLGITNAALSRVISVNVLANGGTRIIGIPTNILHLNTNRLTLVGTYYQLWLTNGNEFRVSLQSNSAPTLSIIWDTFGQ